MKRWATILTCLAGLAQAELKPPEVSHETTANGRYYVSWDYEDNVYYTIEVLESLLGFAFWRVVFPNIQGEKGRRARYWYKFGESRSGVLLIGDPQKIVRVRVSNEKSKQRPNLLKPRFYKES